MYFLRRWMLFLWALSLTDGTGGILAEDTATLSQDFPPLDSPSRPNHKFSTQDYPYVRSTGPNNLPEDDFDGPNSKTRGGPNLRCSDRLETALEQIRRRQAVKQRKSKSLIHLDGYSLHHQLRTVPYDMYVTDMRVRLPTSTQPWVKVDKCRFDPRNHSLETRLLFNDLTISGRVNLFGEEDLQRGSSEPRPEDGCGMILRLRRAGIGFHTEPIRRERGHFNVKTDSHFLEPGFISVYAYGCEPRFKSRARETKEHRRDYNDNFDNNFDNNRHSSGDEEEENLSREMEDIFLKGIRSLLTSYMQKELQPAIKETLMRNMGYTISYG